MSQSATRNRRKGKVVADNPKERLMQVIKAEEEYQHKQPLPKFKAANDNQKTALAMFNAGKRIIFLTGSAGTGKSMLAAYHASCQLKQKKIDQIYLVRPAVSVGKSIGLLPGDVKEKLAPYFMQTMTHLEKFLGSGYMDYCKEKEVVQMLPVEYLRGMSFEHSIVVAEECQNFTQEEMEMMLTRLGEGCTIIFTGDTRQHDLKGESGMDQTIDLLNRMQQTHPSYLTHEDIDILDQEIGIVKFTPDDVVRSGLTKAFVKMYYHN